MTKADIINKIADNTGLQKKDVAVVVESFMESIKDSLLSNKENVYLRGIWKLHSKTSCSQDSQKHPEEDNDENLRSRSAYLQAC